MGAGYLLEEHGLPLFDGVRRHLDVHPQLLADVHLRGHGAEELEVVRLLGDALAPLRRLDHLFLHVVELLPELQQQHHQCINSVVNSTDKIASSKQPKTKLRSQRDVE